MATRKRTRSGAEKPLVPARREPTPRGVAAAKPAPAARAERGRPAAPARGALRPALDRDEYLRGFLRDVPDFPSPGILFRDITPLLASPRAFHVALDGLAEPLIAERLDAVVAIESRGFIFGGALAARLNASFVPVRKPGKLPARVERVSYTLEYGGGELEIHADALAPGARVAIVDDVLATGGTAAGAAELVGRLGAEVVAQAFVVELAFLRGRARLAPTPVLSLIRFD